MLERIAAPRPRDPAGATPPLLASAAVHLALALLLAGVVAHATGIVDAPDERAVLLAPLLPSSAPPEAEALQWQGGTTPGDAPVAPAAGSGRGVGLEAGSGRRRVRMVPGAEVGPEQGGGIVPIYAFDAVIDRPVTRHPAAGAPEYPPALLAARVEGWVMGEWTVDTTGLADSSSLVILEATHPAFAEALRAAMPRLRFLPAEHGGRRVRQRVAQKYYFRVEVADSVRTTS